ncbi:MAG: hypothetical protein IT233_08680 [Bacteroidia bacterium]|nr:hypothetical protein [Bacteroidia bacterium]
MKRALLIVLLSGSFLAVRSGDTRLVNEDIGKRTNEQIQSSGIMSITGYTFRFENGLLGKESYKSSVEMFDRSGRKTEDAVYLPDGESDFSYIYSYNEEGIQLKSVGIIRHKPVYNFWTYELIDSLSAVRKSHADTKKKESWIFRFDEKGRKVREDYINADGYMESVKEFVYDASGRLTERKLTDGYGNVYSRIVFKYDESGNNTERIHFATNDILFCTYILSYDEKRNIKTLTERDHEGKELSMTVYSYSYF